ncbi:septum site-determining protein Ssd [Saccharomonospora piscinae]|uniref:septum site-determining protein Ssd n=1 Tax=Saccharomonospora piscinae TaxID=687388 RepID=UPI0004668838|nr:septum site-determining protein Ssd [Saccharomonospora piscinae]
MTDNRPLVVVADHGVRDHVARLAAAVGCAPRYVDDLTAARPHWGDAPLVLLDELPADGGLPRRAGLLLVRPEAPDDALWRAAVASGVDGVAVLPADEDTVITALADVVERPSTREGGVLAVIGGRGGAGTSVLAAAAGVRAARTGGAALLVDCDPLGGGIDLVLGAEADDGLRWPDLRVTSGRVSMTELDAALPSRRRGRGRIAVLSCDRAGPGPTPAAVAAVVDAGRRAGRTVVCDLPRHPGPAADEVLNRADLVVLVVPADVRGCVAASRVRERLASHGTRTGAVVRARTDSGLTEADVADAVGVPVLAWLRDERAVRRALDGGGLGSQRRLARAAEAVLASLAGHTAATRR